METVLRRLQSKLTDTIYQLQKPGDFFQNKRRWEYRELQADLSSSDVIKQKNAIKRIIANMTLGRDVSHLFVDVVKLGQTENLELKKLVYLYILSTAKLQPDAALLAVNTFLQDAQSPSPLVRALAVRSMMCIRVDGVLEYTVEALRSAVTDSHSYVRKTAAIGLGKLFHHDRERFFADGYFALLLQLLEDVNPAVASNASAIIAEIRDYTDAGEAPSLGKMLQIVNLSSASEWGQAYFMELLADCRPSTTEEAESTVALVLPQVSHKSPAVVLSTIKVLANFAGKCKSSTFSRVSNRVSAAILALTKSSPEVQYVVFKNIHGLIVIFPNLLRANLDAFFIRFHDPPYVKLEKLKLLLKLVTPSTAESVVNELNEYTSEVDTRFLEEVVAATAVLAIKVESAAESCTVLLLRLLRCHWELLSCIIVAAKNISRRYPHLVLILSTLMKKHNVLLDDIGDVEGKVAFIWMLGEHLEMKRSKEVLITMMSTIQEQEPLVQLALLTAVVKLSVADGCQTEKVLITILGKLTSQSTDPDIRDRAVVYWRLLSKGLANEQVQSVLSAWKSAPLNMDCSFSDSMTLKDLKKSINTAAIVFGRPYQSFLPSYGAVSSSSEDDDEELETTAREVEQDEVEHPEPRPPSIASSEARTPNTCHAEPRAPVTEDEFCICWEGMSSAALVATRELHLGPHFVESNLGNITSWMRDNGFIVAAVSVSAAKIIIMASAPDVDTGSLFQVIVDRSTGAPTEMVVKGVKAQQTVHVFAMRLEKITGSGVLVPPPQEMDLDAFF